MTVLNEYIEQVKVGYTWGWSFGGLLAAALAIFIGAFLIYAIIHHNELTSDDMPMVIGAILVFILMVVLTIFGFSNGKPVYKEETRYEVLIDNTIGAKDLLDNYQILDQRGEIYIVCEKSLD